MTLGNQLAGIITGAVVSGFQTGARIMTAPFNYGAKAIGERIRDEMSDVRTAGGLFSISKRLEQPIFKNFFEAEEYTKAQHRYLANLAGALPGDTQEYIQVSKQIADGIFTIVSQDRDNATKLATQLAKSRGATAQEIAKLTAGGPAAMRQTGKEMVGELTKLTVLAGLGGQQGAYGLPQLTERMLAEEQVSMGMFQRYAAIFRDPMIKGALERNIAEINKAGKNTAARYEAIANTFREIVTPELVRRYQRTTAGVLEALRTTFLNPEVGLLGLGRPLAASAAKFDEFGERLFELGKDIVGKNGEKIEKGSLMTAHALQKLGYSVNEVAKAATDNLSIFDYLRDIFANLMIVLQPVIDNIVNIFDPLTKLGDVLAGMRERTMKFQNAFEMYRKYLEKTAKGMEKDAKAAFEGTIPFRAALAAINDAMRAYGGYGTHSIKEFNRVADLLGDPSTTPKQMGEIIKGMLDKFLSSDFAKKIGESLGTVVGTVVAQVGEMMKAAAGLATASKLAEGFAAGFQAAGGPQGFRDIIRSVFALFGKLLIEVIKAAPLETAIAAALFFLPGAIAGLITQALSGGFATALAGGGGGKGALAATKARGGAALTGAKNFLTQGPKGAGPGFTKMGAGTGLYRIPAMASGVPKNFMAGLKAIGPKMLGLGGIISGVIALLEGKSILEALATGLGSAGGAAIGAAIGTVIFPGIGTAIGAAIGGWVGTLDVVTQPLTSALGGLFGAIEPLGGLVGQLWNDVTGVINGFITGFMSLIGLGNSLGEGFSLLQFALFALLSPFKLLQIGILGIYEAYLELKRRIPGLGLNEEEKEAYNRTVAARIKATDELTIEGRQAAGFSIAQQKAEEYKKFKEAKQAGNKAEMNRIAQYMRVLNEKGGSGLPAAPSKQAGVYSPETNALLTQINAKTVPQETVNPVPQLRAIATKLSGANAFLAQVKVQVIASEKELKSQVGASSNNMQAKIQETTDAVKDLPSRFSSGIPVRIIGTPTVRFDMGGMGPVGGGIGGFAKTSGYGMRWGKMHTGNDYAMPVGTKLGIGGPGKVLFAGDAGGYGKMMDIGGPGGVVYRFAHLSKFNAPVGATLPPGFPFALSGNTGRSTGPHLHFEARPGGMGPVNPNAFAGMIRANYAGTPIGGLLSAAQMEANKMPYGSNLAVGNTDEIFMRPTQMASLIEGSTRAGVTGAGNFEVGSVEVTINDNTGDIAKVSDQAAEMILQSMYRQSRAEVITS
jgi:murein DD-endopeptidase MepM/ murein hydrolase activator NlpD